MKRTRKLPSLSNYIYRHSPLKNGAVIKNEDKPLTKVDKITTRIFLGNHQAAKDKEFMTTNKIHAVLNCTKDLPNHFEGKMDIEYLRIPVDDSLKEKDFELMYQFMPLIVEFIDKHVNKLKQNILIHCFAGRQRSAISVCAYLVSKHKMTPHDACKYVLDKRPEAFHHGVSLNFDKSLLKYYKDIEKARKK